MKRIIAAVLACMVVVSTAFAIPGSWVPLLWGSGVHDGISLNFATQTYYTKAPGQPARYQPFTNLFTFTRNSVGTFIGSGGLVEYADHNYVFRDREFDDASWTKTQTTISANATTAPDGTTTADKIQEDATAAVDHLVAQALIPIEQGQFYTVSCYFKPAEQSWVRLQLSAAGVFGGVMYAFYDTTNGAIGTTTGGTNVAITAAGNGWYRASFRTTIATATGTTGLSIYTATADNTFAHNGTAGNGIYAWGIKVRRGTDLGSALQTASAAKYDQPRIEYQSITAGTNFLLQSQSLDNASWVKTQASATANAVAAPDGTTTAEKIVEDSSVNAVHRATQQITKVATSITYTLGFYVKSGERTSLRPSLRDVSGGSNGVRADVDMSAGTITSGSAIGAGFTAVSTSITALANGWYYCTLTATTDTATTLSVDFNVAQSVGVIQYTGDGASGLYIWGVQLQWGSNGGVYAATTTAAPVYINSQPVSLGLLTEGSRTNLAVQSESADVTWAANNVTVTANTVTAPDGMTTADKLVETVAAGQHNIAQGITKAASSLSYTFSVFVKGAERPYVSLRLGSDTGGTNSFYAIYDLTSGTVGSNSTTGVGFTYSSASITSYPNGWWRLSLTGTTDTGTTVAPMLHIKSDTTTSLSYTGVASTGIYIWGAQVEQATFATSYIPTTTASVARSADLALMTGISPWFSQTAGSMCSSYDTGLAASGGNQFMARFSDNSSNNHVALFLSSGGTAQNSTAAGGVFDGLATAGGGAVSANTSVKQCIGWASNDIAAVRDGGSIGVDTSATMPSALTQIELGSDHIGTNRSDRAHILRVEYVPSRKSNLVLQRSSTTGVLQ